MKLSGAAASHQIITQTCRRNRGASVAFEVAMRRLRETYDDLIAKGVSPDTDLHLVLIVQADRHRAPPDPSELKMRIAFLRLEIEKLQLAVGEH